MEAKTWDSSSVLSFFLFCFLGSLFFQSVRAYITGYGGSTRARTRERDRKGKERKEACKGNLYKRSLEPGDKERRKQCDREGEREYTVDINYFLLFLDFERNNSSVKDQRREGKRAMNRPRAREESNGRTSARVFSRFEEIHHSPPLNSLSNVAITMIYARKQSDL